LKSYWDEWCREFQSNLPKYYATVRVAQHFVPMLPRVYGESVRAALNDAPEADEDGWTTLTLTFDSFEAARSSVLGLGTAAEVLEPEELRAAVLEMASGVVDFYQRERGSVKRKT
jgi:predicted DNA-binding transcriptional regulator YafY